MWPLCSKSLKSSSPLFSSMTSAFISTRSVQYVTTFLFIFLLYFPQPLTSSPDVPFIHKGTHIHRPLALKRNKRTSCQTFITAQFVSCPLRPRKQRRCSSHNAPSSLSLSTGTIMKCQSHTTNYIPLRCSRVSVCSVLSARWDVFLWKFIFHHWIKNCKFLSLYLDNSDFFSYIWKI